MSDIFDKVVAEFKSDPRNKVFASSELLVKSASEEIGETVDLARLNEVIQKYLSGDMAGDDESIYDGAVAVCGSLARNCFGSDPDEDIDYEIDWLEQDDGSFLAEIRPN